jgi:hypothetical protein
VVQIMKADDKMERSAEELGLKFGVSLSKQLPW